MSAKVTLTYRQGGPKGKQFVFDRPAHWVIGRADDCSLRVEGTGEIYGMVSRHHCQLDIEPPCVRVRDLGSRNGTYVNGEMIGKRKKGQTVEEGAPASGSVRDLADGDELELWPVVLKVGITGC
jgi:pSer/pThr/pTyr-binding forkhead associated (FHA) protein